MEYVRKYIQENNLVLKTVGVKAKYLCKICKNILCQPKLSNCGCSYCNNCITKSLENNHYCPNCYRTIDSINDLHYDIRINKKILKLTMECPNEFCDEKVMVKDMEIHINICQNRGYKCAFRVYGCSDILMNKYDLNNHMNDNIEDHFNMLIKNTQKMSSLSESIQNFNLENNQKFDDLENRLDKTNEKIKMMKIQVETTKSEILSVIADENSNNLTHLASKNNSIEEELVTCKEKLNNLEKDNQDLNEWVEEIENRIDTKIKEDIKSIKEKIETLEINSSKSEQASSDNSSTDKEFSVNFRALRFKNKEIDHFSETKTLNRYSFQIRLRYNSSVRVSITLVQIPNELIDQLQWPIPFKMKITLRSQNGTIIRTRILDHNSSNNKHSYMKPSVIKVGITDSNITTELSLLGNKCYVQFEII